MPVRASSDSCAKAAYSVTETARACNLSRARFYELIKQGVMPSPVYDPYTRKPFYLAEIHEQCVRVRRTNVGIDGRYVIFYTRRQVSQPEAGAPRNTRRSRDAGRTPEIIEGLRALGITATETQIAVAATTLYPQGIPEAEFDTALRAIFRHLRRQAS